MALACPAKQGELRWLSESEPVSASALESIDLDFTNKTTEPDSDTDPEELSRLVAESFNGSPERLGLSGLHGHRPWV